MKKLFNTIKNRRKKPNKLIDKKFFNSDKTLKKKTNNCCQKVKVLYKDIIQAKVFLLEK